MHKLKGDRRGQWAMTVNDRWHICFEFKERRARGRNRGLPQRLNAMAPVVHPGRLLKREMVARKLSANRLALEIGVPSGRVTDILNGRRATAADTAVRLGRYFGNSAQFWLDRRMRHEPTDVASVAIPSQVE
jgi:addiction module HigA family antidote